MKLSVLMSVYNCEPYVAEAIESILNQTYRDFEFIIYNDGSKDRTASIVKEYADRDRRIVFIDCGENHGLGYALNKCMEAAGGEYFIRMDGDDISEPDRFEIMLRAIESNPDCDVVGSGTVLFNSLGPWGEIHPPRYPNKLDIYNGNAITHASVIIKSNTLRSVGGYSPEWDKSRTEDYDLWCKLFKAGYKMMSIDDLLYRCRWEHAEYQKRRHVRTRWYGLKLAIYWYRNLSMGYQGIPNILKSAVRIITPNSVLAYRLKKMLENKRIG